MSDFSERLIRDTFRAYDAVNVARAVASASNAAARAAYEHDEPLDIIAVAFAKAVQDVTVCDAAIKTVNQLSAALATHERRVLLGAAHDAALDALEGR